MEENTNTQNTVASPQPAPMPAQAEAVAGVKYVGFGKRFVAALIDCILLGIVIGILGGGRGDCYDGSCNYASNSFGSLIGMVYFVVMTVKFGATLGKVVMKIRIVNEDTGKNLDWGAAILREVVGKFLSFIVFFLGYLWVIWDPKKQAWHDKIAGSIVIEGETKLSIAKSEEKKSKDSVNENVKAETAVE